MEFRGGADIVDVYDLSDRWCSVNAGWIVEKSTCLERIEVNNEISTP